MKYLLALVLAGIILGQINTVLMIRDLNKTIDLKILTHELNTPPVSYEEIVAIITDTVVPGAIKEN